MSAAYRLFNPGEGKGRLPSTKYEAETVGEVLLWYEKQLMSKSPDKQGKERKRLLELFRKSKGTLQLCACRPHILLDWINERGSGKAAWTRRRWNCTIQRPFNIAAQFGLIDRNPFKGLTFPQGNEGRDWTDNEYQSVLRNSPAYLRRIFVFIRFSGARPGESRTMEWPNVVADAGAVIFRKHKTSHITKQPRRIPFNQTMVKLLAWLKRHNPRGTKRVFLNSYNRGWTMRMLTDRFAQIREKACLAADVKLHGVRHTFATRAVINGVDIITLAELLGHRNVTMTQRYVHLAGKTPHLNKAMEQAVTKKPVNPRESYGLLGDSLS
jgi:integrase